MSISQILAFLAALLFLIAVFPNTPDRPLLAVGGLLLSLAVYLAGRGA